MAAETKKTTLEREYIIPLRAEWLKAPKHKRAKKAVRAVREFLSKHMKADIKNIKIGKWLNQELWARGIRKPLAKVKIKAIKEDEIVRAEIAVLPDYAQKIEAKEKAKAEKTKKETKKEVKKEEAEKKEEKEIEEAAKEEIKESPEEKEKKEEEKIMHKEIHGIEKSAIHGPEKEPHKAKPFRQALRK